MQARLSWAAALSLGLHAALVAGFFRPHLQSGAHAPRSAVQLRIVQPPPQNVPGRDSPGHEAAVPLGALQRAKTANRPADAAAAPPDTKLAGAADAPAVPAVPQAAARAALAPAPDYRATAGLDPPPRALDEINPAYPEAAGSIEGTVVLRLLISSSGGVDDVAVVSASPAGYFETSALTAFARARFSPGYFLGIPVKSQLFIEVGYTPINRGGAVSGQGR